MKKLDLCQMALCRNRWAVLVTYLNPDRPRSQPKNVRVCDDCYRFWSAREPGAYHLIGRRKADGAAKPPGGNQ
jgi:hypothetical protein